MKKTEIVCDLCGVTVATKEDLLFSRFKTKIPYIKVPYNYIGAEFCSDTGDVFSCNAKEDFHVCENCLKCIKKDLSEAKSKLSDVQRTSKVEK